MANYLDHCYRRVTSIRGSTAQIWSNSPFRYRERGYECALAPVSPSLVNYHVTLQSRGFWKHHVRDDPINGYEPSRVARFLRSTAGIRKHSYFSAILTLVE